MKFKYLLLAVLFQACSQSTVAPRRVSESLLEHGSTDSFAQYFLPTPPAWSWYSDQWQCARSTRVLLLNTSLVAKDFNLDQWQLFAVQHHLQEYLPEKSTTTNASVWRDQDYRLRLQQAITRTREGLIPEAVSVAKQLAISSSAPHQLISWDQLWKIAQLKYPKGDEGQWSKQVLNELERQVGEELLQLSSSPKVLVLHSTCLTSSELKQYLQQPAGNQLIEGFSALWGSDTELFSQENQGPVASLCCSLASDSSSSKYNSSTSSCHCSR